MKALYILLSLNLLTSLSIVGQSDTIVVYDVVKQSINEISPVTFDSSVIFDKTASSLGLRNNKATLNVNPPISNLYSDTYFSKLKRADLFYDISDYPIRTATRLFRYINDTLTGCCSGILISDYLVLTTAHCIRDYFTKTWRGDSILI